MSTRVGIVRLLPRVLGLLVLLTALGLLIWEATFASHPGPTSYYSHFSGLFFATSLSFEAFQLLLTRQAQAQRRHRRLQSFFLYCAFAYWAVLTISGLASTVAYGIANKGDCIGLQILIFLTGAVGIHTLISSRREGAVEGIPEAYNASTEQQTDEDTATILRKGRLISASRLGCWGTIGRSCNRFFKFIHLVFSILFIVGGINLALTFKFDNPGTAVAVTFPDGSVVSISYNCTSVPASNSSSLPTIWFASSPAHGVVDFLGLQIALAEVHGRNSCSYDPPNFGWSSRMPASESTFFDPFPSLLEAIGRQSEDKILAGWADGANSALANAVANPDTVKGLVLLDVAPDGIEWLDEQRAMNWTQEQLAQHQQADMDGRIELARLVLAIGITWGLMPLIFPANSTAYFDSDLYPRYHAQSLKEDMWAMQYYAAQQQAASPIPVYLETQSLPQGMPTFAIMSYDSGTDAASDAFYRQEKLMLADHIAGGNLTRPVIWCTDNDCSLSFPVAKWAWTADALMSLGI